jgi:hypothetical protein
MRFGELRSILQRVVLVGLPACTDSGSSVPPVQNCGTATHHDLTVEIASAAPPMQLRIESCQVDADACPDVCAAMATNVNGTTTSCNVTFDSANAYIVMDTTSFCGGTGRMPAGLVAVLRDRRATAGAWLAHAAWLEAASVPAFVMLARELEAHRAPRELIAAALAAAGDEIRHAAIVGALARRYGAQPAPVEVAVQSPRSLEALAIENAVEGCVRETWGAALALWQSHSARDPEVRAAFAAIAGDELRHAELGWAIDRWARTRLDAAAVARIDAARAIAVNALLAAPPDPELGELGLPEAGAYRALRTRAHRALWTGGVA